MKKLHLHHSSLRADAHSSLVTVSAALALFAFGASAASAPSAAVTPYTFIGRVTDNKHAGFDANRVCTLAVYDASGNLLGKTQTVHRDDTRDNYALKVPVATRAASGYAVQTDALTISATDDTGKVWQGVVPDALCGEAGGLRRVDIVLGEDGNGDNIDDSLYDELRAQWEASDYWEYGATFDPNADYDGDGVSTIAEAYAGTNPFDPDDNLRITAFALDDPSLPATRGSSSATRHSSLSFTATPGRAYTVQTTTNLTSGTWEPTSFALPDSATTQNAISVPTSKTGVVVPITVYLLPTDDATRFFRIHLE